VLPLVLLGASEAAGKGQHALGVVVQGVKPKMPRNADVTLRAKVNWRGPKADLTYAWSSVEGPALPSNADSGSTIIMIPKDELEVGGHYHLRLRVKAEWKDEEGEPQSTEAASDVEFDVNAPPRGGKCTLDTRWVGSTQASLTLGAPGWKDDDQVQYRYSLIRNGKESLLYNWATVTTYREVVAARRGDTLQAKCGIRDKYGDGLTALSDPITRE